MKFNKIETSFDKTRASLFLRFQFSGFNIKKTRFPVPIPVLYSNAKFQPLVVYFHTAKAAYILHKIELNKQALNIVHHYEVQNLRLQAL